MIGKTISHYQILKKSGGGGMSVICKVEDTKLDRLVLLKFLPEKSSRESHALERFEREAQAASALNHPDICTIDDIDEHEVQRFIAMEILEWQTIKHRIGVGADSSVCPPAEPASVYAVGGILPEIGNSLVWLDKKENVHPAGSVKAPIFAPRLFPDGQRIAYQTLGTEGNMWVYDLNRGTTSRLTNEGRVCYATMNPLWGKG